MTLPPLGLAVFESLRAEDEPWLAHCYVPPDDLALMAGWRSALVFGEAGSGKTALRLVLEREWCPADRIPPVLLVSWQVTLAATQTSSGMAMVLEQMEQVLHLVAEALLQHLAGFPTCWQAARTWAQATCAWFIRRYWRGDLAHHVASLEGQFPAEGLALLQQLVSGSIPDVLYPGTPTSLIIGELVKALQNVGLEGVRVVVDGLEPWMAVDARRLAAHMEQFLSALALFENSRFTYTMLLPSALESPLWSAGSIVRRRADTYRLEHSTARLRSIVERRLSLALGEPAFGLGGLTREAKFATYLERCGGASPRGWLETARPFLAAYLRTPAVKGKRRALGEKECLAVKDHHAPRLHIDPDSGRVTVGWRAISGLQPGQQALLHFLYRHRGQTLDRHQVYQAYLEGTGREVPSREFPKDYASTLDNAVYRLRQAIEPDPAHPVLVQTVKGEGFCLKNAW